MQIGFHYLSKHIYTDAQVFLYTSQKWYSSTYLYIDPQVSLYTTHKKTGFQYSSTYLYKSVCKIVYQC